MKLRSIGLPLFVFLGAASSIACGGQADSGEIPRDSSNSDAGVPSAAGGEGGAVDAGDVPSIADGGGTDAGACPSSLSFLGGEETIVAKPEPAPEPTGGAVRDGTYVLTTAVLYTGPGGASGPTPQKAGLTIRMAGGVAEIVTDGGESRATATYAVAGTTLSTHQTCPAPRDQTVGFTAQAEALVIFLPRASSPSVLVETLVRKE